MFKHKVTLLAALWCGHAVAQEEMLAPMRAALIPAVIVQSAFEKSFKVKLDCTPAILSQARSDSEAYTAIKARKEIKGWTSTGLETVMGGAAVMFVKPNSQRDVAIGSIGSVSTYGLLICKSNKPLKK